MISRTPTRRLLSAALRASPSDLITGIAALALAPIVELGLRTIGVRRTASVLKVRLVFEGPPRVVAQDGTEHPLDPRERRRLTIAWRILELGPFEGTCLRRAFVGARLLRGRDHAVRIGVRKTPVGFKAHAWLEVEGISLDPEAPDQFSAEWHRASAR